MNKKLKYILKKEQLQHLLPIFKNQCVTDLILGDLSANDLRDSGIDKLAEQRLLEVFKTTAVSPALGHFVKVKGGALPKASELAGKKVETFEVGMHPVTVNEWNDVKRWAIKEDVGIDIRNLREQPLGCPVTWVDWYDCAMWCNAKSMMENLNPAYSMPNRHDASRFDIEIDWRANGYRLPTEHEWEWAARGGCNSQSYTFAGSNNLNDVGWHSDNADGVVQAVGKKMPNELGLYDMSGNVWEWCCRAERNERLFGSNRYCVIRGGSSLNLEKYCTLAYRDMVCTDEDGARPFIGFRLARSSVN